MVSSNTLGMRRIVYTWFIVATADNKDNTAALAFNHH